MATQSILPSVWDVPEIFRQRLGREVGRQRAMSADGHLLLVLHAPPSPEDLERQVRFFWRQTDGTWKSDGKTSGVHALVLHLEEFEKIVETLEQQDDAAANSQDYFSVIYRLSPVLRTARNLHQALQQARELCPEDRDLINLRDRAYNLERTAELVHQDARHSLEFEIARKAEQQAEFSDQMAVSAHRLNILVAFFFPIATLSAIFGVNMIHGLEDVPGPMPLILVLVAGLVCGFFLKSYVTAKPTRPQKKSDD